MRSTEKFRILESWEEIELDSMSALGSLRTGPTIDFTVRGRKSASETEADLYWLSNYVSQVVASLGVFAKEQIPLSERWFVNIDYSPEVTSSIESVREEISRAQRILGLEDNWDDEGSPGYDKETLDVATGFLLDFVRSTAFKLKTAIPAPKVRPGPEGSIDIFWKTESYTLLVNFPKGGVVGKYFGQNKFGEETSGLIEPALKGARHGLILWLTQT